MSDKKKVLCIDDDPSIGEMVTVALEDEYDVITAADAKEGMAKIKSERPDCILLDIMMPGDTGVSLLSDMSQDAELAKIPVIMVSGVAKDVGIPVNEKELGEYVGLKPRAFIEKPVDPEKLIEIVRDVIG